MQNQQHRSLTYEDDIMARTTRGNRGKGGGLNILKGREGGRINCNTPQVN